MSMTATVRLIKPGGSTRDVHQSRSGRSLAAWLGKLHLWLERRHQRDALGTRLDDQRLLADIGLTRDQALREASKPFWR